MLILNEVNKLNLKKIRILRNRIDENYVEDLNIDQGCCYFHDREELKKFTDIDDEIYDDIF